MRRFFTEIDSSVIFRVMQRNTDDVMCNCEAKCTKQRQLLWPSRAEAAKAVVEMEEGIPLHLVVAC